MRGGRDLLRALTRAFYATMPDDPILEPVFRGMNQKHVEHVAGFLAEVFGRAPGYSEAFRT